MGGRLGSGDAPCKAGPAVRAAVAADVPAIEAVVASAYEPYVARMGRRPGPMDDDYGALVAAGRVSVAEESGRVAGVLVLVAEGETTLLDNVAVDPAAQGRGVGRALLQHAEATARAAGAGTLRLYTHELMVENIRLYARIGFRETHRAEERGFRRVFMAKPLAGED